MNHGPREMSWGRWNRDNSLGISAPGTDQPSAARASWQTSEQHSHFMSCNSTWKNPAFRKEPGAGQGDGMPSLPPGLAPHSQPLGNIKFLGLFCCLKTNTLAKRHPHPPARPRMSPGAELLVLQPSPRSREPQAATSTAMTLCPPKPSALRPPWPSR